MIYVALGAGFISGMLALLGILGLTSMAKERRDRQRTPYLKDWGGDPVAPLQGLIKMARPAEWPDPAEKS